MPQEEVTGFVWMIRIGLSRWRMGARSAHALMIATGVAWRKLDMPGIEADRRWRILRCSAERSDRFSGEDVYIVGGGELGWTGGDVLFSTPQGDHAGAQRPSLSMSRT